MLEPTSVLSPPSNVTVDCQICWELHYIKYIRYYNTLCPIGRPVRATITLYPIGRPVRATITLYPIGRPVRVDIPYNVEGTLIEVRKTEVTTGKQKL